MAYCKRDAPPLKTLEIQVWTIKNKDECLAAEDQRPCHGVKVALCVFAQLREMPLELLTRVS